MISKQDRIAILRYRAMARGGTAPMFWGAFDLHVDGTDDVEWVRRALHRSRAARQKKMHHG